MAKYTVRVDSVRAREIPISRRELSFIIEGALDDASKCPDYESTVQPDLIREIAATADRIDAITWKAADSCGCPMVKAGRVTIGLSGGGDELPSAINTFVRGYDRAAKTYADPGYKGAITFIVS